MLTKILNKISAAIKGRYASKEEYKGILSKRYARKNLVKELTPF